MLTAMKEESAIRCLLTDPRVRSCMAPDHTIGYAVSTLGNLAPRDRQYRPFSCTKERNGERKDGGVRCNPAEPDRDRPARRGARDREVRGPHRQPRAASELVHALGHRIDAV